MSTRFQNHKLVKGFIANEALDPYRAVVITSTDDEKCEYPAAQFDPAIGITATGASSGEMVDVVMEGICLAKVDGNAANIAVGDSLVVHSDTGLLQKAAGGAAGNRAAIAVALAASTADGDVIPVQLSQHKVYFAS